MFATCASISSYLISHFEPCVTLYMFICTFSHYPVKKNFNIFAYVVHACSAVLASGHGILTTSRLRNHCVLITRKVNQYRGFTHFKHIRYPLANRSRGQVSAKKDDRELKTFISLQPLSTAAIWRKLIDVHADSTLRSSLKVTLHHLCCWIQCWGSGTLNLLKDWISPELDAIVLFTHRPRYLAGSLHSWCWVLDSVCQWVRCHGWRSRLH